MPTQEEIVLQTERRNSIINNTPATFEISNNPNSDSRYGEWRTINSLGILAVSQYNTLIEQESNAQGVNADWVRAIVYLENGQGIKDHFIPDQYEQSILPMNIQKDTWTGLGYAEEDFYNPEKNIEAGVKLIKRISDRLLPEDRNLENVATLYNGLFFTESSNYGARAQNILDYQLWTNPEGYDYQSIADIATSYITNSLTSSYERFKAAISLGLTDPLIIDMGDDGLQLKSWEQSGVMFDLNANGTIEQSGWTTANGNDVFLAIDKNSNGNIDDISELFGNATTPGFKELKNFDSNNDNVIDANDSQFGLLKIWNDANANGVVDTGEMTTLAENNVTSISLKYISSPQSLAGNLRLSYADVNFADGSVRTIHEVAFGKDEFKYPLTQIVANDNEVLQLKLVA